MRAFILRLLDVNQSEEIFDVVSFIGEDASGGFSILASHARMMTCLVTGLARFRRTNGVWQYLAMPSALLYFNDNTLTLSTRRFLIDDDYLKISSALQRQLLAEEEKLLDIKRSLRNIEEEVFKRMWQMEHPGSFHA